jgi:hypothetical protein
MRLVHAYGRSEGPNQRSNSSCRSTDRRVLGVLDLDPAGGSSVGPVRTVPPFRDDALEIALARDAEQMAATLRESIAALPRVSRERDRSGCGETPCSLTIASVRISCLSANFVQHEPNSVDDQRGLICDDIMTTARADNPKATATGR